MPDQKNRDSEGPDQQVHETEYRRHRIRIVEPRAELKRGETAEATLYIDDEPFPVEITEHGVLSHDMAFKMYGSIDELAEDLVRQRGSASIERGDQPSHHQHDHDHGDSDHGDHEH